MLSLDKEFQISAAVLSSMTPDEKLALPINMLIHAVSLLVLDTGYALTCDHLRNMADLIEKKGMSMEFPNGD